MNGLWIGMDWGGIDALQSVYGIFGGREEDDCGD